MNPVQYVDLAKLHQKEIWKEIEYCQKTREATTASLPWSGLLEKLISRAQVYLVKLAPRQIRESV